MQLKLERHEAAARTCSAVLVVNPDSVAALYRRGRAYTFCEPKLLEEARCDFGCAASLSASSHPSHRALRAIDQILADRKAELAIHEQLTPRMRTWSPSFP